jgi:hypothetical protein
MLNDWLSKEDQYMNALLVFDDIGEEHLLWVLESSSTSVNSYFRNCTILMHRGTIFHRIALWERTTGSIRNIPLAEIGLVSFGHVTPYTICPNPGSLLDVTAVHINGHIER